MSRTIFNVLILYTCILHICSPKRIIANRARQLVNRVQTKLLEEELEGLFRTRWSPLTTLFSGGEGRRRLYGIVRDLATTDTANAHAQPAQ